MRWSPIASCRRCNSDAAALERWACVLRACCFQYSKRSVFLFDETNAFRKAVVWLVEWRYFDAFILCIIIANSIILGLADFGHVNEKGELADTSWRNRLIDNSEMAFTVLFSIEALLKIISMGFVLSPNTYLRDGWNVLDFIVVVAGCA